MLNLITRYWSQISLLFCIFFVVSPLVLVEHPALIILDCIVAVYWANEFVVSVKRA